MRLRRKSGEGTQGTSEDSEEASKDAVSSDNPQSMVGTAAEVNSSGPYDINSVPTTDGLIDLGALLVPPSDLEVQLNVDEASGQIVSISWLGAESGMEASVFAAPRSAGVWDDLHPDIAADATSRGGTVDHREGPFGSELMCSLPVELPDGTSALHASRIFACEGPRWLIRCALMGAAAIDEDAATPWYELVRLFVVRRGGHAMPVGDPLELHLPDGLTIAEGGLKDDGRPTNLS